MLNLLKVGTKVAVSNEFLHEKYKGILRWGTIHEFIQNNTIYYDMYDYAGNLLLMDGEECIIEKITDRYILLLNQNGESDTHIRLTKKEFDNGCFIIDENKNKAISSKKYKVKMEHVIELIVECESEDEFMDWASNISLGEVVDLAPEFIISENFYDNVIEEADENEKGYKISLHDFV